MLDADLRKAVDAGLFCAFDTVAGMTLVAYDYLLMLSKEKRYIWNAKWTPGKIVYVIVRYLPFIDMPLWPFGDAFWGTRNLPLDCETATYITLGSLIIACFMADFVYGLRTWALWSRNNYFGWFLIFCGLGFNVTCIVLLIVVQPNLPAQRIDGLQGCFLLPTPSNEVWKAYLLTTCFQIVLFLATLIKGLQHYWLRSPENLTTVLYRDAFLSYLAQICIGLVNVTLLLTEQDINYSMDATYHAFLTVLLSRIILNIREAANANSLDRWDVAMGGTGRGDTTRSSDIPLQSMKRRSVESDQTGWE